MGMRLRVAVLVTTAALLGSCSSDGESGSAVNEMRAVVRATLKRNFHFKITNRDDKSVQEGDYESPDRVHIQGDGPQGLESETFVIGEFTYLSSLTGDGTYTRAAIDSKAEPLPFTHGLLQSRDVSRDGSKFTIRVSEGLTTVLTASDGLIRTAVMTLKSGSTEDSVQYDLSRFDQDVTITAPAAELVKDLPMAEPNQCIAIGDEPGPCPSTTLPDPADLLAFPAAWRGRTSSIQLRPVRVSATSASACATQSDINPDADQEGAIRGVEDECFATEPAELELTGTNASASFDSSNGAWYVQLRLSKDDSSRFDAMAKELLGRQVAIVIFGHVISAPTIQATSYDGKPTIVGRFSEDFAKSLASAI